MENFIISMNAVLPLFLMMAVGFIIKTVGLFDDHTLKKMNKIVFSVFLPILMFNNIYTSDIAASFNGKLLAFSIVSVLIIFFAAFFIVKRLVKDNPSRGVVLQSQFRSNFILFAVPVLTYIFGEGNTGEADILIAIIVPFYNVLAVINFELFRGGKLNIKKTLLGIIKNPIIIGSALGIIMQLSHVHFPYFIEKTVSDLSKAATPVALVILGGFFSFKDTRKWFKLTIASTLSKLILIPLIFVPISVWLGFRDVALASLMIMYGAPVAVSSFTMAMEMDGNSELANQIVVFTSLISVFTIFVAIFILKTLGLI